MFIYKLTTKWGFMFPELDEFLFRHCTVFKSNAHHCSAEVQWLVMCPHSKMVWGLNPLASKRLCCIVFKFLQGFSPIASATMAHRHEFERLATLKLILCVSVDCCVASLFFPWNELATLAECILPLNKR